jgi:hypothetical protein
VEQVNSTVCDGETGGGKKVPVVVTFNNDGSYLGERQWR